jgi:hypothetical protein
VVRCDIIEQRHPRLEGKLKMKIEYLGDHSTRLGVFRAFLDLGICAGPAILGLDADLLNEYVWALAEETGSEPPYDEELERLTYA